MATLFTHIFLNSLPYETPFFFFSLDKIKEKYQEFVKAFPSTEIYYAMKANSELKILQSLLSLGSCFEVASVYELEMLKKINVPPDKIVYGTSVKPQAHVKEFWNYGISRFAFDSLPELEKIATVAKGARVFLRISVNDDTSVFKFSEKFGADKDSIITLLKRSEDLGLIPYGISFHVGSQSSNPFAWANGLKSVCEPIRELEGEGITLEILNLGGGFPCKYLSCESHTDLQEIAKHTLSEYHKLPYQPKLIIEPGRGLIAETGVLVTSVIAKVKRKETTWLFLDVGVYNGLFEAMSYQGSTRYRVSRVRENGSLEKTLFALAGPTGDSPDVITREISLPSDTEVGDKLLFHDVGAYSISVTSEFNGFPKPKVYFI